MEIIDDKQVLLTRPAVPSHVNLTVDGIPVSASADYALRFVDNPGDCAAPVLYFRGRRVIKPWMLTMSHQQPADPWGCSG